MTPRSAVECRRQALAGSPNEGNKPLFLPFAPDPDEPLPEVRVLQVDTDELADSDSARIEQLEDGSVPQVEWLLGGRNLEKTGHLFLGEERGDALLLLGGGHQPGGVLGDPLLLAGEPEERADGGGLGRPRAFF